MEKKEPEFQWTQQGGISEDPIESEKIFQSQVQVMRRLFGGMKNSNSLANWHMRRSPMDLHLYAGFGLVSPVEYNFLDNQMTRWQNGIKAATEAQLTENNDADDDDDDNNEVHFGGRVVGFFIPAKRVHTFLRHLAEEDFDRNENWLLRFAKPVQLVRAVNEALYAEGVRTNPKEGVSVVDELLCQQVYPQSEVACWVWMNKMVAANSGSPLKMQLKSTAEALRELNEFQLYKAVADIYDFSMEPNVKQRINGKLEERPLFEKLPRVHASLDFLLRHNFLDPDLWNRVVKMPPEVREDNVLQLKRGAVSSFLCDIAQAAPDNVWLNKMVGAFGVYFQQILRKVGWPILASKRVPFKNENGKDMFMHVINVEFAPPKNLANTKAQPRIQQKTLPQSER